MSPAPTHEAAALQWCTRAAAGGPRPAPNHLRSASGALLALLLGSSPACTPDALRPLRRPNAPVQAVVPLDAVVTEGPPRLPATALAHLDDPDASVLVARRGRAGLLAWPNEGRLLTRAFGAPAAEGPPTTDSKADEPHDAGAFPGAPRLATIRPLESGYLVAWAQGDAGREEVVALALDESGAPRGERRVLATPSDSLRWVEVVPTAGGAIVVVESERRGGRELAAVAWPTGRAPAAVARGILAWHVVASGHTVALATVESDGAAAGARRGRARLREIDQKGQVSAAVELSQASTAMPDVQVAAVAGGWLVAWTDAPSDEPGLLVASVKRGEAAAGPSHEPLPRLGEQALLSLTGAEDGSRALLAWEAPGARAARSVELVALSPKGETVGDRARLEIASATDMPQFAGNGSGFVALTLAPMATVGGAAAAANEGRPAPYFVHFADDLSVVASEPVRLEPLGGAGLPYLTRAPQCEAGTCTALCTSKGQTADLWLVDLARRTSPWRAPATRLGEPETPRATALTVIAPADGSIAGVVSLSLGDGSLLAWSSDLGGSASSGAISLQRVGRDGGGGAPQALSTKALPLGGISLARAAPSPKAPTGSGKSPTGIVGWAALNEGAPQVFLTVVDENGAKIKQKAVTRRRRAPKGVNDQGVSFVDVVNDARGGYLAAWIDERDGDPEVYVARFDEALNRRGAERRLTSARGSAGEVRMLAVGDRVFVAWSDGRDDLASRMADIYFTALDIESLETVVPERPLAKTPAHSRTPQLVPHGGGVLLAWIEEVADAPAEVRLARMDLMGRAQGELDRVTSAEDVGSVALRCTGETCRGIMATGDGAERALELFVLPAGAPGVGPRRAVLSVTAPADPLVPLADDLRTVALVTGPAERLRIRRLDLLW